MPAENPVGFSSVLTRANFCETPPCAKPPDEIRIYDKPLTHDMVKALYETKTQEIRFDMMAEKYVGDEPFKPAVSTTSSLDVILESSNPTVADIREGKIRIKKEGTTDITAYQTGSLKYAATAPVTQTLTVGPKQSGIAELGNNSFSVYPNPVSDYLYIMHKSNSSTVNVKIYSLAGELLSELKNHLCGNAINISFLNNGAYILNIDDDNGKRIMKKIIVSK